MENTGYQRIDGKDILGWFSLGAQEVATHKKYLNSINLFPVADGDTGTNLSTTMRAMVEDSHIEVPFNAMIHRLSVSGLAHARGNSGILFASYIKGLAIEGKPYESVTIKEFSQIAHNAVPYLYQAIENPMEGTMISVIKDWAAFLFCNREKYVSFQELLHDAYSSARDSLMKTATQLEILKRNHMVDSGAEGFVRFLNGINRYFGSANSIETLPLQKVELIEVETAEEQYQYCTEFYMELSQTSVNSPNLEDSLKHILKKYGDSLIVSLQNNRVRIHIHTDTPDAVAATLRSYGRFLEQKADNMKLQNRIRTDQRSRIALLTDSIADLPEEDKLQYQIHTLPLGLLLGDSVYLDKLTIKPQQIFQMIPGLDEYPTSSQPEPGRVAAFLENLLDNYDSLIYLSVADKLSGSFRLVTKEAEKLAVTGKKITVIDSRLNSGAQGLLVKQAASLLAEGFTHDDIVTHIKSSIPKTKIYVCLNTLEYAIRSGRVPNTIGKLGMKLGLRPIMTLDENGKGAAFGAAFSKKSLTHQIYRLVKKTIAEKPIKSYAIVHSDNPTLAEEYRSQLTKIIGKPPEFITEISSIVAIHSGPGCVAVCLMTE